MKISVFVCVLALFGCAAGPRAVRTTLPSGEAGYSISCADDGSINACYEVAGEICASGYEIVKIEHQDGATASAIALSGGAPLGVSGAAGSRTTWQRALLVNCNGNSDSARARYDDYRKKQSWNSRKPWVYGVSSATVATLIIFQIGRGESWW